MANDPVTIKLVDVAAAARQAFGEEGAKKLFPDGPLYDWRFHIELTDARQVTFSRNSTASEVVRFLEEQEMPAPVHVEVYLDG